MENPIYELLICLQINYFANMNLYILCLSIATHSLLWSIQKIPEQTDKMCERKLTALFVIPYQL